jgi:hypothetical protein
VDDAVDRGQAEAGALPAFVVKKGSKILPHFGGIGAGVPTFSA